MSLKSLLPGRPGSMFVMLSALGTSCASDDLTVAPDQTAAHLPRDGQRVLATPEGPRDDAGIARVQILAFNDFHGHIEPPTGSSGSVVTGRGVDGGVAPSVPAGGAASFARHVERMRAENPNTLVVSAGDLIGASPLTSALFRDEPTVEAMNLIGLDINAVGNHEFDDGRDELLRLQHGGCHPVDGCRAVPFTGARFQFLGANVIDTRTGKPPFPRYSVREVDGVRVAFIGMTLEATPTIVTPSGVAGLRFLDEADTVNGLVPELREQGVESLVVVIHEGGYTPGLYDGCDGISGPIVQIVERLDDAVDLVISGHTHQGYNCLIDGKRVTSALSFGRLITQIALTIDRATQDVVAVDAHNRIVTRDVTPVAQVADLVSHYVALASPLQSRIIGQTIAPLSRSSAPVSLSPTTGESTLGDVIADAQLAATRDPARTEPAVAFMNPGGVRADLDAGEVSYGEAFAVQPFGNTLVVMTLTGAQLKALLEQQFTATTSRVLLPSANLRYAYDAAAAVGSRVRDLSVDGVGVEPTRSYRVTVNSFLATGGDGFTVLNDGTERIGGPVDVDALAAYLTANSPLKPPSENRITRLN